MFAYSDLCNEYVLQCVLRSVYFPDYRPIVSGEDGRVVQWPHFDEPESDPLHRAMPWDVYHALELMYTPPMDANESPLSMHDPEQHATKMLPIESRHPPTEFSPIQSLLSEVDVSESAPSSTTNSRSSSPSLSLSPSQSPPQSLSSFPSPSPSPSPSPPSSPLPSPNSEKRAPIHLPAPIEAPSRRRWRRRQPSTSESEIPRDGASDGKHHCHPCKIAFKRRHDLQRHLMSARVHEVEKFCCPTCNKPYSRMDGVLRHMRAKHACMGKKNSGKGGSGKARMAS